MIELKPCPFCGCSEITIDYDRLVMPSGDTAELRRRLTKAEARVSAKNNLFAQFVIDWRGE